MSRACKFVRLIRDHIRLTATRDNEPHPRDKDIAELAQIKPVTFNAWLNGRTPPQFADLLALLDFLSPEEVGAIFREVHEHRKLKNAFRVRKPKKKLKHSVKKKPQPAVSVDPRLLRN